MKVTLIGSNGQISIENFIFLKKKDAGLLKSSLGSILLEKLFFINVVSSLHLVTLLILKKLNKIKLF